MNFQPWPYKRTCHCQLTHRYNVKLLLVVVCLPWMGCRLVNNNWTSNGCEEAGLKTVRLVVDDGVVDGPDGTSLRGVLAWALLVQVCCRMLSHFRLMQHCFNFPVPPFFFLSAQKRQLPHSGLLQPTHWPHLPVLPKVVLIFAAFMVWSREDCWGLTWSDEVW